jgi:hypothetical protein
MDPYLLWLAGKEQEGHADMWVRRDVNTVARLTWPQYSN